MRAQRFAQKSGNNNDMFITSDEVKKAIAEARQQIRDGKVFTNEQVQEEIKKLLEEK